MMPRDPGKFQKERGEFQRRKILALLEVGRLSAQDISAKVHLSRTAALLHIQVLREQKLVRIAGYVMQYKSREIPLYGLGSDPDETYIKAKFIPAANSFEVQREKVRQEILAQLRISPATSPQLAIFLGLSNPTMRKYLPMMHAERLIHRSAWVKKDGGGMQVAIWAAGNKPDAPKSKIVTKPRAGHLPQHQVDLLWKKKEAKEIVSIAMKKPQGIFAALGL